MQRENLHVSDEELLLAADGELPSRRAAEVRSHLAACWNCRARMAEIEGTIVDFARSHRQTLDPNLPAVDGPRARLKAELAAITAESNANSWHRTFWSTSVVRAAAYVSLGLFAIVLGAKLLIQHSEQYRASTAVIPFEPGAVPDHGLTPGATRRVTIGDVCSMADEDVVREVPMSLRQRVFQEYGIANARADDYEIDYLIAPGLGGVEDIHNLWPEPYTSPMWNAHVKDALEEHLHQLVCAGKVDLSTAQNDIATDWIAAYKKYFHTDRPLSLRSWLDSMTLLRSPRA
jgi:anti-sigma factor RsiW